jgi:hypothetical protein
VPTPHVSPECPDLLVSLAIFLGEEARQGPAGTSVAGVLEELAVRAAQWIPEAASASVSTTTDEACATAASTSPRAAAVDAAQYALGSGPCLATLSSGSACYVTDLHSDPRWPLLGQWVRDEGLGVTSALSTPVSARALQGHTSLNVYSERPHAFGGTAFTAAMILAVHTGLLLDATINRQEAARLRRALAGEDRRPAVR